MNIFEEFRHLAAGNSEALEIIDLLEFEPLEMSAKRRLADYVWRLVCPAPPRGQRHLKDSFWGKAQSRLIHWGLFGHKPEQTAKWMQEQQNARKTAIFQAAPFIPQVRTGK